MLAFKYQDKKRHLSFPCHVQPKLNGIRMLYNAGIMQSRSHGLDEEKQWPETRLTHLRSELANIPADIILDGELYVHGWSLQKINSAASINRLEDNEATSQLQYHIFDCINLKEPMAPFAERTSFLKWLMQSEHWQGMIKAVQMVATYEAPTLYIADTMFASFRQEGYEGAMFRQSNAPYGFVEQCKNKENRWPVLLKRKQWLDDDFDIVGFNITIGTKGEKGFQLHCETERGALFAVGSGLSDLEVLQYEQNPPIGKIVKVKYEMLSDAGVPLKPSVIAILD